MRKTVTLQVNGQDFTLGQQTWIMGILNVTPDSFSDGNLYFDRNEAVKHGLDLINEGASILDIGAESSRPGSDPIPVQEELERILPVISEIRDNTDTLLSVDTTKAEVARRALDSGADIINDISSFKFDPDMLLLAAERETPVILMHMKGNPKTMQSNPSYENLLEEVKSFFQERIDMAVSSGIKKEKIIIDPGIGFGKNFKDNLNLIRNLRYFENLGRPILVGHSRKSFIGKIVDQPPQDRLEGSLSAAVLSVSYGAHLLRVHDVAATKQAILVADAILNEKEWDKNSMCAVRKNQRYVF
ncbi:MAG: dihydropteroate synthase [Candidatus Aminicenantes bacterium]|nr:dihydropteroate synthase [Candidatus Aminicenantes bacterium]